MNNTRDLSQFGYRELKLAAVLLAALKTDKDKTQFLGDGVAVEFNPNSGMVFLVDDCCNTAAMNGDELEDFHYCNECGHEDFESDFLDSSDNECCKQYFEDMAV